MTLRLKRCGWLGVLLVALGCVLGVEAQGVSSTGQGGKMATRPATPVAPTAVSVLRLIKFSGSAADAQGRPLQGAVGVTFALYADQQGGSPLWVETQNVTLDPQGRYTALLGATQNGGLPLEIFASGEARWLGIMVQGQAEQPRVLLVAVPYALKAAEAETLSGKRASDFVTTEQLPEQVQRVVEEQKTESASASQATTGAGGKAVVTSGATNFTDTTTDQVVKVTQNGTGYALLAVGTNSNGIFGATQAANANVYGIFGQTIGAKGGALIGFANSTTGTAVGVQGVSKSATGTAGAFVNTAGGRVLLGRSTGSVEVFHVNGDGGGFFAGNVGIGTASPASTLDVSGTGSFSDSTSDQVLHVVQTAPGILNASLTNLPPVAVLGVATDTGPTGVTAGVGGLASSPDGVGVIGGNLATSGQADGILGISRSTEGVGTEGFAESLTGVTIGVRGEVASPDGIAGRFFAPAGAMLLEGVGDGGSVFQVDAAGNVQQSGDLTVTGALSSDSASVGSGSFSVDSSGNVTAQGTLTVNGPGASTVGGSLDVSGALSSGGISVNGGAFNVAGTGEVTAPFFTASGSGPSYISGSSASTIGGDLYVAGFLSKSSGSFKIDHPLDPANKYLYHSFVESPDMMNIYNGNAVLDAKGEAVVELPEWFQALNKDFRYQLTCIGGFAGVYIAEEIRENRFKIAGGKPGMTVSWQVTGIRQDAYATAHRVPVEEQKPEAERGYYLHPELFGQPPEKGIQHARRDSEGSGSVSDGAGSP